MSRGKPKSNADLREAHFRRLRERAALLIAEAKLLDLNFIDVEGQPVCAHLARWLASYGGTSFTEITVPKPYKALFEEIVFHLSCVYPAPRNENHQALRPPTKIVVPRKDDRRRLGLQRRRHG